MIGFGSTGICFVRAVVSYGQRIKQRFTFDENVIDVIKPSFLPADIFDVGETRLCPGTMFMFPINDNARLLEFRNTIYESYQPRGQNQTNLAPPSWHSPLRESISYKQDLDGLVLQNADCSRFFYLRDMIQFYSPIEFFNKENTFTSPGKVVWTSCDVPLVVTQNQVAHSSRN